MKFLIPALLLALPLCPQVSLPWPVATAVFLTGVFFSFVAYGTPAAPPKEGGCE